MGLKKDFYQSKHPFGDPCFEALSGRSWRPIKNIVIRNGTMTLNFVDDRCTFREKVPFTNVRVKSRQATLSDCICFLRPGIDISVLSTSQNKDGSSEARHPVWLDARICSIERKPHETGCSCQFYINLYNNQGSLGSTRETLTKEITEVGINQISILQKLGANYCEDRHFRWDVSEDCPGRHKAKLFIGKFLTDMTWLLVTSSMKKMQFDVRPVQDKLVYQIVPGAEQTTSSSSVRNLHALNFKLDKGTAVPVVVEFIQEVLVIEDHPCDTDEAGSSPYSVAGLRRSKRRKVQPERFIGCDSGSEIDIGYIRSRPCKVNQGQDEELNSLTGSDINISSIRSTPLLIDQVQDEELNVPLSILFGVSSICFKSYRYSAKKSRSHKRKACDSVCKTRTNTDTELTKVKSGAAKSQLAIVPFQEEKDPMAYEYYHAEAKNAKDRARKLSENSPKRRHNDTASRMRKNAADMDEIELEMKWGTRPVVKKSTPKNKYHQNQYKNSGEERAYSRRSLSVGAYTDLINEYLKNIDINEKEKEEPDISEQWKKEKKTRNQSDPARKAGEPVENEEEDMSETEMIWKEMEMALASTYILDNNEGSNVGDAPGKPSDVHSDCEHDFILNEEIGVWCSVCGFVFTEIRDVSPPFVQNMGWYSDEKKTNEENLGDNPNTAAKMNFGSGEGSPNERRSEENENVWSLIPEIRTQLQLHQKKAFEFLWKNIAGSLTPESTTEEPKKTGGCVISHSPGAGKTFLIIAFLVSYLKIFPGKRPVILAPKTALYTWYKEFIKWKIPIPVYLIHGRRTYRVFRQGSVSVNYPGCPKPTDDVKHTIDCLEKIQKWHSHPSVLVMGYPSFLSLMREDSKYAHRKFMAKVLRESPGILVLDEGHNPRSTKSRLRKALMKVETNLRILLSGTVFQNNFCEYFNTLCLARPKFVNEVLRALDPKYKKSKKKNLLEKGRMLMESRARKFFLDTIAKKIDSNTGNDRKKGLKQLKKITNKFIDVYENGGSDTLPGLQIYTLLMNSTDKQHDILVKLHRIMSTYNGFPLELELLITLGSIHPWLVKTTACANKFFTEEELLGLDKYKYDLKKGSKVKFVLNLVYRVAKTEKILIFCHNIAPVKLFVEFFERVFRWQKGKEVLVLTGDLELFDRGRIMDRFEEPGGESRVLLASISACAEGISLTAASRVIMLDSEWNPSKTKQAIARAFRPGQQKVVYVYQLLATGTLEEDKYRRTTWKEWVSSMIFSEEFVEDPSKWQAEKIEDDVLRELVAEDKTKSFHMIMKNEKASTVIRDKE